MPGKVKSELGMSVAVTANPGGFALSAAFETDHRREEVVSRNADLEAGEVGRCNCVAVSEHSSESVVDCGSKMRICARPNSRYYLRNVGNQYDIVPKVEVAIHSVGDVF